MSAPDLRGCDQQFIDGIRCTSVNRPSRVTNPLLNELPPISKVTISSPFPSANGNSFIRTPMWFSSSSYFLSCTLQIKTALASRYTIIHPIRLFCISFVVFFSPARLAVWRAEEYIQKSPRLKTETAFRLPCGTPRKISPNSSLGVPNAVSIHHSPPKMHLQRTCSLADRAERSSSVLSRASVPLFFF